MIRFPNFCNIAWGIFISQKVKNSHLRLQSTFIYREIFCTVPVFHIVEYIKQISFLQLSKYMSMKKKIFLIYATVITHQRCNTGVFAFK